MKNKPFVLSLHGVLSKKGGKFYDMLSSKRVAKRAHAVGAASKPEFDTALDFGIPRDILHIIPHGITLPLEPQKSYQPGSPLTLLYAGLIRPDHRLELILRAAKSLTLPFRILIVETGNSGKVDTDYVQSLTRLARVLGLEERVTMYRAETREALISCYQEADVFVYPATREDFGQSLLEAAAYGLPIVATPVGAVLDLVVPGKTGYILPADPNTFSDHIMQLHNPDTRRQFSRAMREHTRTTFGWSAVTERYLNLYKKLTG